MCIFGNNGCGGCRNGCDRWNTRCGGCNNGCGDIGIMPLSLDSSCDSCDN